MLEATKEIEEANTYFIKLEDYSHLDKINIYESCNKLIKIKIFHLFISSINIPNKLINKIKKFF